MIFVVHSPVSFIVHRFRQTSGEDFDVYLQNVKAQSEAFRSSSESSRIQCFLSLEKKTFWFITDQVFFFFSFFSPGLPSDTNVVTPNTECSWDFTTKTRSTNDDVTSLDLEWEDEEGETPCLSVTAVLIFPCTPSLLTEFQHKSLDLQESIGLFQSGRDLGQKRTSCVRRCGPVANT